VLPPDGPPTLLHPCLHEGYNRTYRRLSNAESGRQPSPPDLLLLGRCAAIHCFCGRSSPVYVSAAYLLKPRGHRHSLLRHAKAEQALVCSMYV
jgi:hypothetical protein